jgi:hypothetical protein
MFGNFVPIIMLKMPLARKMVLPSKIQKALCLVMRELLGVDLIKVMHLTCVRPKGVQRDMMPGCKPIRRYPRAFGGIPIAMMWALG